MGKERQFCDCDCGPVIFLDFGNIDPIELVLALGGPI